MPLDKKKVRAIHDELRGYFKGQLKSSNKRYLPDFSPTPASESSTDAKGAHSGVQNKSIPVKIPGEAQRTARNQAAYIAGFRTQALRDYLKEFGVNEPTTWGYIVLDRPQLFGNCFEMCCAAAYLVHLRKAGTATIVGLFAPGDHTFCLVSDGLPTSARAVKDFACDTSSCWVIDVWANVCCSIQDYEKEFTAQMRKWSSQGKHVIANAGPLSIPTLCDPASYRYLDGFRCGPLAYGRASLLLPVGLPRAMRPDADRTPVSTAVIRRDFF